MRIVYQYREHSKNARHTGVSELKVSQEKLKNNFALLEQSESTNKAIQNELKITQAENNELKSRVSYTFFIWQNLFYLYIWHLGRMRTHG